MKCSKNLLLFHLTTAGSVRRECRKTQAGTCSGPDHACSAATEELYTIKNTNGLGFTRKPQPLRSTVTANCFERRKIRRLNQLGTGLAGTSTGKAKKSRRTNEKHQKALWNCLKSKFARRKTPSKPTPPPSMRPATKHRLHGGNLHGLYAPHKVYTIM